MCLLKDINSAYSIRETVSQELKKLVEQDVIEKSESSEWVSPIVVTKKKTGGIGLCVDLREPNKAVVIDNHPLPHIEEIFSELRGAKFFSTLDLQSAYHQVLLHEESRDLTAFITHDGLFRFKRVPYGLASAPSCFQRLMSSILHDIPGCKFTIIPRNKLDQIRNSISSRPSNAYQIVLGYHFARYPISR